MKATADGMLIGPDADAIAIRNLSAFPIRVKQMDTTAETPFHLVDDVAKSSGNNDFQMSMNDTAVKQTVELPDDGTWAMGYAGNEDGNDVLPIAISNAKIARVTADLSAAKKAATVTWTVEPTAKDANQPGTTAPGVIDPVREAVAKDAKDWTLEDQRMAALDIEKHGTSSVVYAKAKAAMDAGTKFTMKLTNGQTLEYRIIGIDHDDLADGSGKAGLTFLATNEAIGDYRMNATDTNAGGWEKSELRQKMNPSEMMDYDSDEIWNSGEIWNLMPDDFQSRVASVRKLTNNVGGTDEDAALTATTDKLFLLSYSEIVPTSYWASDFPWTSSEGTQYEAFKDKVTNNSSGNDCLKIGRNWWERSVNPDDYECFFAVDSEGDPSYCYNATDSHCVCPAWCF